MTDEKAFLAHINAHPNDDAPKLIYADWLEERGQPALAEWLRGEARSLSERGSSMDHPIRERHVGASHFPHNRDAWRNMAEVNHELGHHGIGEVLGLIADGQRGQTPDLYSPIVFMQGEEATEPLGILDQHGPEAAIEHLSQWDHNDRPYDHRDSPLSGSSDYEHRIGNSILNYNNRHGYIGLSRIHPGRSWMDAAHPDSVMVRHQDHELESTHQMEHPHYGDWAFVSHLQGTPHSLIELETPSGHRLASATVPRHLAERFMDDHRPEPELADRRSLWRSPEKMSMRDRFRKAIRNSRLGNFPVRLAEIDEDEDEKDWVEPKHKFDPSKPASPVERKVRTRFVNPSYRGKPLYYADEHRTLQAMTPKTAKKYDDLTMDAMADRPGVLMGVNDTINLALAGRHVLGEYDHARSIVHRMFQSPVKDSLFAGINAALSPNTGVPDHTGAAMEILCRWVQAKEPNDRESITRIMEETAKARTPSGGYRYSTIMPWKLSGYPMPGEIETKRRQIGALAAEHARLGELRISREAKRRMQESLEDDLERRGKELKFLEGRLRKAGKLDKAYGDRRMTDPRSKILRILMHPEVFHQHLSDPDNLEHTLEWIASEGWGKTPNFAEAMTADQRGWTSDTHDAKSINPFGGDLESLHELTASGHSMKKDREKVRHSIPGYMGSKLVAAKAADALGPAWSIKGVQESKWAATLGIGALKDIGVPNHLILPLMHGRMIRRIWNNAGTFFNSHLQKIYDQTPGVRERWRSVMADTVARDSDLDAEAGPVVRGADIDPGSFERSVKIIPATKRKSDPGYEAEVAGREILGLPPANKTKLFDPGGHLPERLGMMGRLRQAVRMSRFMSEPATVDISGRVL